jgi:hypothetical protein
VYIACRNRETYCDSYFCYSVYLKSELFLFYVCDDHLQIICQYLRPVISSDSSILCLILYIIFALVCKRVCSAMYLYVAAVCST